jgi:type III pantothenate kinase
MILCIDAGNSRIKIAVIGVGRIRRLADVRTSRIVERPERFIRLIHDLGPRLGDISGASISSVVPGINRYLRKAIREELGVGVLLIDTACRFPFRVATKDPAKVGVDRFSAAAGLHKRTLNAIIVDIGSAITVDLVRKGSFVGGLIMPGPALGLHALGTYTRKLPEIDYKALTRHFPADFDDTRPSMILGTHIGALGGVREAVRFLTQEARGQKTPGPRPAVFITGGGARAFAGRWPARWRYDPDLVLRGVHRIWVLNRG